MNIELEWNEAKRQDTLQARGLDFADLTAFDWDGAMIAEDDRKDYGETRYVALSFMNTDFVGIVYTVRRKSIRIISLRTANNRERKIYDHFKAVD